MARGSSGRGEEEEEEEREEGRERYEGGRSSRAMGAEDDGLLFDGAICVRHSSQYGRAVITAAPRG